MGSKVLKRLRKSTEHSRYGSVKVKATSAGGGSKSVPADELAHHHHHHHPRVLRRDEREIVVSESARARARNPPLDGMNPALLEIFCCLTHKESVDSLALVGRERDR